MAAYEQAEAPYRGDAGMVTQAVRETHVNASLAAVDDEAQALLEAVRELDRRLADVLRPDSDSPEKMMMEPRSPLVPLAERLTSHSGTVRMARQYVVSILDRLEL